MTVVVEISLPEFDVIAVAVVRYEYDQLQHYSHKATVHCLPVVPACSVPGFMTHHYSTSKRCCNHMHVLNQKRESVCIIYNVMYHVTVCMQWSRNRPPPPPPITESGLIHNPIYVYSFNSHNISDFLHTSLD